MHCWTKSNIASILQIYFIGFSSRIFFLPIGEKMGLVKFTKFVIIPLNILSYTMGYQTQTYAWRCVGFFLMGMCRIKMITGILILKTQSESKYHSYAGSITYALDAGTLIFFSLFLQFISRNAIAYLHFVNAVSIFCCLVIILVAVESPSNLILKGKFCEAKQALNKITKINHFFKKSSGFQFKDSVKIFLTEREMLEYQKLAMQGSTNGSIAVGQIDPSDSDEAPEVSNPTFTQLVLELLRINPRIVILCVLARMYSNSFW